METQHYPCVEYKGKADEHDIFVPANGTLIECGALLHLNGMVGLAKSTIVPGTHGTLEFPHGGIKLRCPFAGTDTDVAAGGNCYLNRATGVVRAPTSAQTANEFAVRGLPRKDRAWTAGDAAAKSTDTIIEVVLTGATLTAFGGAAHIAFTGAANLGN